MRYGISGPSDVMWTVDDEIRDELKALVTATERGEAWSTRVDAVLKRAEEMIYKERNILFPICAVNFTEAEWQGVYRDAKAYTELNYQFLTALSMTADEFRPRDLPLGWEHSPAEDGRNWITKATEQRYTPRWKAVLQPSARKKFRAASCNAARKGKNEWREVPRNHPAIIALILLFSRRAAVPAGFPNPPSCRSRP